MVAFKTMGAEHLSAFRSNKCRSRHCQVSPNYHSSITTLTLHAKVPREGSKQQLGSEPRLSGGLRINLDHWGNMTTLLHARFFLFLTSVRRTPVRYSYYCLWLRTLCAGRTYSSKNGWWDARQKGGSQHLKWVHPSQNGMPGWLKSECPFLNALLDAII